MTTTACPATSTNCDENFRAAWKKSLLDEQNEFLAGLNRKQRSGLLTWWKAFAHAHQVPPLSAQNGEPWTTWLLLGGRGAGKTHAGAAWVRGMALGEPP